MSSHHIVKEDQEPALILDDFDAISDGQLGQLLEWSPTVIAHRDNCELIAAKGIKIDVLFSNEPIDLAQGHTIIQPLSDVFLDDALSYLVDKGYQAVNIVSHAADPAKLLNYAKAINATLLGHGKRISVVKSGFSKWKSKGEPIFVCSDVPATDTTGLVQQGAHHYLTESDGFYAVYFATEYGLVGELL